MTNLQPPVLIRQATTLGQQHTSVAANQVEHAARLAHA